MTLRSITLIYQLDTGGVPPFNRVAFFYVPVVDLTYYNRLPH
jgi:hypothetical protein